MKNLIDIIEGLKVSSKTKIIQKTKPNYFPTNNEELNNLVSTLIKQRGKEADLNDIDTSKINSIMKTLKEIIQEKLKINSKSKVINSNLLSFEEFKKEILKFTDEKFFTKFYDAWSYILQINDKHPKQFKLIPYNNDTTELHNYGSELVNHPSAYNNSLKNKSFQKIYHDNIIDVATYLHKDKIGDCIYFIDYQHDKFYIYLEI